MRSKTQKWIRHILLELLGLLAALLMIMPVYVVVINAFKPFKKILTNTFAFPDSFYLDSLLYVWDSMNYLTILKNTILSAIVVVVVAVVLSAMCGYKLSRVDDRKSKVFIVCLLASMIIPFQSIMLPVYQVVHRLGQSDNLLGYMITLVPLYAPFAVFVYHGFVKTVPRALEESAIIDGCGPFRVFFQIVFPLMSSTTASIVVLFTLWVWNDYTLPSLLLRSAQNKTLTTAVYSFFSSYYTRWDYGIASLTLAIMPITLFFIFMQKYFVSGMVAGAIKG
ncbi:MAG: carbohydrate ABC transporter permease [Eubacteriales bacterium]|nr:carbohydrate ABC transporter permease [Eubacteriales bacterium]